jgi:GNAT superfamily N-acetyltransferase
MESADLRAAMALGARAGWNQTELDWQRLLALSPEGCFVAASSGELAGTVTTIRYGRPLGWIGMMLVEPRFRRRGIATALMARAIAYLRERRVETIALDATDAGRAVYTSLGFEVEDQIALTRVRRAPGESLDFPCDRATTAMLEADLDGVIALDEASFGVDRSALYRSLWSASPRGGFVQRDREGVVQGFVLTRPGATAAYVGPWCASSPDLARSLLHAALGSLGAGQAVFVDLAAPGPGAPYWLAPLGFHALRSCTRMRLGSPRPPGRPETIHGISGFETG